MTLPKASEFPSLPADYYFEVRMREDAPGVDSRRYDLSVKLKSGEIIATKELAYEEELILEAKTLATHAHFHSTRDAIATEVDELNEALYNMS